MAFATYNDFRVAVQQLIDSEASTESTFSTGILDTLIALGEDRVYLGDPVNPPLRTSLMLFDYSTPAIDGLAPLPNDCLELHSVEANGKPVEVIPLADLHKYNGARHCAQKGDQIAVSGAFDGDLEGTYYARPERLATELHGTFNRYPSLYLYAALIECANFVGRSDMAEAWGVRYSALAHAAQRQERWMAYNGSPLTIRAR